MNQTQTESMRFALEALEGLINRTSAQAIYSFMETERRIAISACVGLREALAEQPAQIAGFDVVLDASMPPNTMKFVQPAQQEPVAWWNPTKDSVSTDPVHCHNKDCQPLYTSPPAQCKPLTVPQIIEVTKKLDLSSGISWIDVVRAIEAAHGIKEQP